MHRITTTATALLLAAGLVACGSSDNSKKSKNRKKGRAPAATATRTPSSDTAGLERSVRDYTAALFNGDGKTGYALVSKRCKTQMTAAEFDALADQAHHDYGPLKVKTLHVDQLSGDLARVSYGVGVPQFERKAQPWAREDGTWRWDACSSNQ